MLIIPYTKSQLIGVKGILGIDGKFRSHDQQISRRLTRKGPLVKRVFSRLKNPASHLQHGLRGVAIVTLHAQLGMVIMLLTA